MGVSRLPKFFGYPLLSQERIKLPTSNFVGTFTGSTGTKAHENVRNSSRGRSQGHRVPTIFRAPMYKPHCAVIFAIAQLSCPVFYLRRVENDVERLARDLHLVGDR